jgi:uncharacterized protein YeaO (DUF488 family)
MRPGRVRVGRVYEARTADDGMRVLVDRLWPRGMTKARADLDEWCKDVAPTTELRTWYAHDPQRFAEFARRYRKELAAGPQAVAVGHVVDLVVSRHVVTLLTAARDPQLSEAAVLAQLLEASASRR